MAKAEAAFNDYRKFYPKAPGNQLQFSVAQARIAFAKNNVPQARQALESIIQTALKAPAEVTRGDGAAYGQAFYLLARLQEREKNYQGALENYLRVTTLFYQTLPWPRVRKKAPTTSARRKRAWPHPDRPCTSDGLLAQSAHLPSPRHFPACL